MLADNVQLFYSYETMRSKRAPVMDAFFFDAMTETIDYKQVKARFRGLALVVHPDHYPDAAEKRQAGRSMRVLMRAMEIVDAEKRYFDTIEIPHFRFQSNFSMSTTNSKC